jgi:hypothetical protein
MGIGRQISQYGRARLARRLGRSLPILGAAIALFTLRRAIRQKGFRGGVADSALDATPFVGAAKNMYEVMRGDIIPDRVPARATGTRR